MLCKTDVTNERSVSKANAQNKVLLFINFLRKIETEKALRCTGAGISIIPNPDEYGNLGFIFFSMKQHTYAEDFVDALLSFDIKDWELENAIKTIKESLEDLDEDSIVDQLFMYNDQVNKTNAMDKRSIIDAMSNINVADLN